MPAPRDLSDGNHIHLITIRGVLLLSDMNRYCRGAMNKKELVPWCRRGLLAYVYNGVSD